MKHSIIEDLLKNKFVLRKTTGSKFAVHCLGAHTDKYPVMIDVLNDRIFMYRDHASYYKSFMMKEYNLNQFINNYYDLLEIDVDVEMLVRSFYFTPITMRFILKHSNHTSLMKCPEYSKIREVVRKLKDDFMTYIKSIVIEDTFMKNPDIPQEFKSFVKNTPNWQFLCQMHTLPLDMKKAYLQERLLRRFIQLQKTQGITYESIT